MSETYPLNLLSKRTLVCGLQGSGKSFLGKEAARKIYGSIVIDPLNEYYGVHRFIPKIREYEGIEEFLNNLRRIRPTLVIADEANRFFPSKKKLPIKIAEEYDFQRHTQTGWLFIVRRPQSLNADLLDLIDQLIVFKLVGLGDLAYLKGVSSGMEEKVRSLGEHEFVLSDYKAHLVMRLQSKTKEVEENGSESTDNGRREEGY